MNTEKCSFGKPFLSKRFVGIAIVLSLLFLVVLPTIAAEDDFVLGIYGNANEDNTIDMRDLTYVKLIFFGEKPETEFADAKYDGKINPLDFVQIKLIIVGKEKELTFTDRRGKAVTVNEPVERVIVYSISTYTTMRAINAGDAMVGICSKMAIDRKVFFPEVNESMWVGYPSSNFDFEKAFALDPDLMIAGFLTSDWVDEFEETIEAVGIPFALMRPASEDPYEIGIVEMGYIFGKVKEAYGYHDFLRDSIANLTEMTEDIPEEDKPRVYLETRKEDYKACGKLSYPNVVCKMAGGNSITCDTIPGLCGVVDPEWVVEQNPDIIIKMMSSRVSGYEIDDHQEMMAARDAIMNRSELSNVSAVKNGRVYVVSCSAVYAYSYIGVPYLMKVFYPDRFSDLDPTEIHQRDVDFQGLNFDVKKQGVFIYPPL
ncbi:hypothetical protein C4E24_04920 [ANME-1 cluster archaeon AG-394-G21]|nr:hypothetical protein [ANME-1 cluster archaeon AG-394-G21]